MDDGPIHPIIQPNSTDTMLNNKGLNIVDGLNFVMCEQTFKKIRRIEQLDHGIFERGIQDLTIENFLF